MEEGKPILSTEAIVRDTVQDFARFQSDTLRELRENIRFLTELKTGGGL